MSTRHMLVVQPVRKDDAIFALSALGSPVFPRRPLHTILRNLLYFTLRRTNKPLNLEHPSRVGQL